MCQYPLGRSLDGGRFAPIGHDTETETCWEKTRSPNANRFPAVSDPHAPATKVDHAQSAEALPTALSIVRADVLRTFDLPHTAWRRPGVPPQCESRRLMSDLVDCASHSQALSDTTPHLHIVPHLPQLNPPQWPSMAQLQKRKRQQADNPSLGNTPSKKTRSSVDPPRPAGRPLSASKRPHPAGSPSDNSQNAKKQKRSHPARRHSFFWDNSTVFLEKSALQELERRNIPPVQVQRPLTRSLRAELNRAARLQELDRSVSGCVRGRHISRHAAAKIRAIAEQAAKLGGPDLSDLRGVCRSQSASLSMC